MQYDVHWIDVSQNLLTGVQPVFHVQRPLRHGDSPNGDPAFSAAKVARTGNFWTPKTSVVTPDTLWTLTREGEIVVVPVIAYRTQFYGAAGILQTGLHLGAELMRRYRQQTTEEPKVLHIVLGNDCTPLADAFRCYAGFTIHA